MVGAPSLGKVALSPLCCSPGHGRASVLLGVSRPASIVESDQRSLYCRTYCDLSGFRKPDRSSVELFRFVGWWNGRMRNQSRPFPVGVATVHSSGDGVTEFAGRRTLV